MQADLFSVSRFLMMCCPAGATPFGFMVQANNATSFTNDAWVEIQGTVQETTMNGKETLQIKASRIQKINPPASPYIYTNPDSVAEFDERHSDYAARLAISSRFKRADGPSRPLPYLFYACGESIRLASTNPFDYHRHEPFSADHASILKRTSRHDSKTPLPLCPPAQQKNAIHVCLISFEQHKNETPSQT